MVDRTKLNTAVEMYRASLATPETLDAMRFWVQNELKRIQQGFRSADERIRDLGDAEGVEGPEGPQGITGATGADGEDGRGIMVFQQSFTPSETESMPGDVWFVTEVMA